MKDPLVKWLEPAPMAYRTSDRGLDDSAATLA